MQEQSFMLSQLIGKTISSVHAVYDDGRKKGLQEFHCFMKLSDGTIVGIPVYDDEVFFIINETNRQYFKEGYDKGSQLSDLAKEKVEGKVIEDIVFLYTNGQISEDRSAYLKLSSGYYFTEINYRPIGINDVGIALLQQTEFEAKIKGQNAEIKSYLKDIRQSM